MKKKFYTCYVMAKEDMTFKKYPALCILEERHEVDLGLFTNLHHQPRHSLIILLKANVRISSIAFFATSSFYSILMDGSTDAGNVEDELVSIQCCVRDDTSQTIRSNTKYLSLCVPTSLTLMG